MKEPQLIEASAHALHCTENVFKPDSIQTYMKSTCFSVPVGAHQHRGAL